ncbi:MAG: aminopeptidase P family protein [Bacteroidaceae bacterium]|nr:aminopeptidase P family protein [Bacteroidaceae bacterium]
MKEVICSRVAQLRGWLQEHHLQAYIIGSSDPHGSEYTPDYWQCRQWISGFDGSAGTAVIVAGQTESAALWTDSRYFLAAAEALDGTPFVLMKERVEGTPTIAEWLASQLGNGDRVGIDGKVCAASEVQELACDLNKYGIELETRFSALDELWKDRPPLPLDPIKIQPLEWAGEDTRSKIARVMDAVEREGCTQMLVSQLDEIAWLLNLRGNDVHCNPVFVSYCLVGRERTTLFCDVRKVGADVVTYLKENGVTIEDYAKVEESLKHSSEVIMLSPQTNAAIAAVCTNPDRGGSVVQSSPISTMKSQKNASEILGMKQAMRQDGVALVKWLRWLEMAVPMGGETELSIDAKLTELRSQNSDYEGLSFDTIAAYKEHGAIVHYEATPDSDIPLRNEGLLLVDTGAQYICGTTDITRTLLLGSEATAEERRVYTLVLKGHIALSRLKFPRGASGTQLDLAARAAMWREGYNYGHGTGHGVGSHLCVHEGPHQIRMNYVAAPISEGMTVTDEPGIYLAGRFGVRIENVLLCVPYKETEFGTFVGFEPLTLCPIDLRPVEWSMMTSEEIDWLNDYHATVAAELLPLLDDEADREWLRQATKKIDNK